MTKSVDFLIVGGGIAGTTAAQTIRSLVPDSSVVILSDENYELYSRVLLSSYIRGEITQDQIFFKKPEWYQENKIELVKEVSAQKLDANEHTVVCNNGDTYQYKKLLLALGARPIKLNVLGSQLANISYMWTIEDAQEIISALTIGKKGVVIGGGFIGLEFAHAFKVKGIETILLDGSEYYWGNRLDRQSSQVIQNILEKNGIKVVAGEMVEKFTGSRNDPQKVGQVITKSGKEFDCDLVGIGVGIKSDLTWLEGSGIKVDQGVVTNEYLETNLADIYAAGDCANFYDVIIESQHLVGTWANAATQGVVVAKTMVDVDERTVFEAVSSYTARFFASTCSFIGMTEEDFADEVIIRGSVSEGKIARIFVKKYPSASSGSMTRSANSGSVTRSTSHSTLRASDHSIQRISDSMNSKSSGSVTRIIGAIVVNNFGEVAQLVAAIKNKVDIIAYKAKLSDFTFNLSTLIK